MKFKKILCVFVLLCLLTGCGTSKDPDEVPGANVPNAESSKIETPSTDESTDESKEESKGEDSVQEESKVILNPYQAPPLALSEFHDTEAVNDVKIDVSAVADGYVAVSAVSAENLKFQVIKDPVTYTYDIASDGTPSIFPLQCGNGSYLFRVMEHVSENKYAEKHELTAEVQLTDEFQPYLRPSDYVNYSESSECVKVAREVAAKCETELDVVTEVFKYISWEIDYDKEKAATLQKGYLPNPDDTLKSQKGICFDYAALTAAMLRSQGIPTRMIFGYVEPNNLYHAWNMFYTEETGWVTVDYEVKAGTWNRLDLTFSANGADTDFIGNGTNYADLYVY